MATTQTDLWPATGLSVTAGDLTLSTITDDDLPGLIESRWPASTRRT